MHDYLAAGPDGVGVFRATGDQERRHQDDRCRERCSDNNDWHLHEDIQCEGNNPPVQAVVIATWIDSRVMDRIKQADRQTTAVMASTVSRD